MAIEDEVYKIINEKGARNLIPLNTVLLNNPNRKISRFPKIDEQFDNSAASARISSDRNLSSSIEKGIAQSIYKVLDSYNERAKRM